jgi:hypothetical protein
MSLIMEWLERCAYFIDVYTKCEAILFQVGISPLSGVNI